MRDKIKNIFLDLVKIDSPSGHEEQVSRFLEKNLNQRKIKWEKDDFDNLIAYLPAIGEQSLEDRKPFLLCAHMDTVAPGKNIKAIVKGNIIKSEGDNILGADDKAGIAEILVLIDHLRENNITHRALELVFTREEEVGMIGAAELSYRKIKAKKGLIIDSSGSSQTVVMGAPYLMNLDISVKGKSAHAGKEPEKGVSAIQITGKAIGQLTLGRIDEETTINIGTISGGQNRNVVPDQVYLKAEVRSHDKSKLEKYIKKFEEAFRKSAKQHTGKLIIKKKLVAHGYCHSFEDDLIKKVNKSWQKLGTEADFKISCGASDANHFMAKGIKAVDVGYGGIYPHSSKERVDLREMEKVVKFLVKMVSV